MKDIRILNYSSFFPPSLGGIETHIRAFAKYSKYKHYVLTDLLHNTPHYEEIDGIKVFRIAPSRSQDNSNVLSNGIEFLLGPIRELNKIINLNKLEFDILHLHGSYGFVAPWELWFPPLFAILDKFFKKFSAWRINGKPIVMTVHSLFSYDSPSEQSFLSKLFLFKRRRSWIYFKKFYPFKTKYILCVTPRVRDIINYICENGKIIFIPSGVDTGLFRYMNKNEAYKLLPKRVLEQIEQCRDNFLVLYVGRFDALKGTHLLKEFADKLPVNIKLIVAGYGNTRLLGKSENLVYVGKIENKKIPALINSCDVVFTPILHRFTTPRVIYEAMACGKPIIVWSQWSRYPVVEGKNAFFVSNMNEAIETVIKLQRDSTLYERIGHEAMITAHENSVQKLAQKIDKIYEELFT